MFVLLPCPWYISAPPRVSTLWASGRRKSSRSSACLQSRSVSSMPCRPFWQSPQWCSGLDIPTAPANAVLEQAVPGRLGDLVNDLWVGPVRHRGGVLAAFQGEHVEPRLSQFDRHDCAGPAEADDDDV